MPQPKPLPTQQELHNLFDYSVVTGELYRKTTAWNRPQDLGKVVGSVYKNGYISVNLGQHGRFTAHRLVWKWVTGEDPEFIDHIDNNRQNNSFHNLRSCNQAENNKNRKGVKGYTKRRYGWQAQIFDQGKRISLGRFDTEAEARAAYEEASRRLHGEFSSVG